jgi:hypothetical protein
MKHVVKAAMRASEDEDFLEDDDDEDGDFT